MRRDMCLLALSYIISRHVTQSDPMQRDRRGKEPGFFCLFYCYSEGIALPMRWNWDQIILCMP